MNNLSDLIRDSRQESNLYSNLNAGKQFEDAFESPLGHEKPSQQSNVQLIYWINVQQLTPGRITGWKLALLLPSGNFIKMIHLTAINVLGLP